MNKGIQKSIRDDLIGRMAKLESLLNCRAGKLLKKGKCFIVVAYDEPYFLEVYRKIRAHEKRKGTWTDNCERYFMAEVNSWIEDPCV